MKKDLRKKYKALPSILQMKWEARTNLIQAGDLVKKPGKRKQITGWVAKGVDFEAIVALQPEKPKPNVQASFLMLIMKAPMELISRGIDDNTKKPKYFNTLEEGKKYCEEKYKQWMKAKMELGLD